jgi:hypothetical protein
VKVHGKKTGEAAGDATATTTPIGHRRLDGRAEVN